MNDVINCCWPLKIDKDDFKCILSCTSAVKRDGKNIQYVPDKFKSVELCSLAIEKDGENIKYIPDELKSVKLCSLAIKKWFEF